MHDNLFDNKDYVERHGKCIETMFEILNRYIMMIAV